MKPLLRRRVIGPYLTSFLKKHRESHRGSPLLSLAPLLTFVFFWTCLCVYVSGGLHAYSQEVRWDIDNELGRSRKLLSTAENATGLPWERCDFENNSGAPSAWAVFHFLMTIFCFVGLAVICDDFFVPSLEVISEKLDLSEDVAGATFMAAGSSAPELFTSVAGVAQETDVGVGTIVGSAVFNILMIIALTGLLAKQILVIDCRPLTRDISFYAMSIIVFVTVSWDGIVQWYEALTLLCLYVVYIIVMKFNSNLMDLMAKTICGRVMVSPESEAGDEEDPVGDAPDGVSRRGSGAQVHRELSINRASFTGGHARRVSLIHSLHSHSGNPTSATRPANDLIPVPDRHNGVNPQTNGGDIIITTPTDSDDTDAKKCPIDEVDSEANKAVKNSPETKSADNGDNDNDEENEGIPTCPCSVCPRIKTGPPDRPDPFSCCCSGTVYVLKWAIYAISFPYYYIFTLTIPDCSTESKKKFYLLTFLMSVFWIAALSFAMTTIMGRFGCILSIDPFSMGLVVIAIGTSVPDCLSSILVARNGFGDMAVSNAIGSNVFDINLGLGLPLLISSAIHLGKPVTLFSPKEAAAWQSGRLLMSPHAKFGFILWGIVMVVYSTFILSKFRLSRWMSATFITLYFLFLIYAFIQDSSLCDGGISC